MVPLYLMAENVSSKKLIFFEKRFFREERRVEK